MDESGRSEADLAHRVILGLQDDELEVYGLQKIPLGQLAEPGPSTSRMSDPTVTPTEMLTEEQCLMMEQAAEQGLPVQELVRQQQLVLNQKKGEPSPDGATFQGEWTPDLLEQYQRFQTQQLRAEEKKEAECRRGRLEEAQRETERIQKEEMANTLADAAVTARKKLIERESAEAERLAESAEQQIAERREAIMAIERQVVEKEAFREDLKASLQDTDEDREMRKAYGMKQNDLQALKDSIQDMQVEMETLQQSAETPEARQKVLEKAKEDGKKYKHQLTLQRLENESAQRDLLKLRKREQEMKTTQAGYEKEAEACRQRRAELLEVTEADTRVRAELAAKKEEARKGEKDLQYQIRLQQYQNDIAARGLEHEKQINNKMMEEQKAVFARTRQAEKDKEACELRRAELMKEEAAVKAEIAVEEERLRESRERAEVLRSWTVTEQSTGETGSAPALFERQKQQLMEKIDQQEQRVRETQQRVGELMARNKALVKENERLEARVKEECRAKEELGVVLKESQGSSAEEEAVKKQQKEAVEAAWAEVRQQQDEAKRAAETAKIVIDRANKLKAEAEEKENEAREAIAKAREVILEANERQDCQVGPEANQGQTTVVRSAGETDRQRRNAAVPTPTPVDFGQP